MAKGDDIQERLVLFGVAVADLCGRLPNTAVGRHFADQLLRSGTGSAANYAEARGAESRRDFGHKLGIVLKELKESSIWLDIVQRRKLASLSLVEPLHKEAIELCRIISVSIRTLREGK